VLGRHHQFDVSECRIVLSPDGQRMVLLDRKGPRVFLVTDLHSPQPLGRLMYDESCGMNPPLQAGAWPVCGSLGASPCWDMEVGVAADGRLPLSPDAPYKRLPVTLGCCFFGAGSQVWLGDVDPFPGGGSGGGRGLFCVADLSMVHSKFLLHDILPISSNTLLVLNRHSQNTGLWQVTSTDNWSESTGDEAVPRPAQRALAQWARSLTPSTPRHTSANGAVHARFVGCLPSWKGPHGMTLAPDRRSVLVVDTGAESEQGHRGGLICQMSVSLTLAGELVVGPIHVLEECSPARPDAWNPLQQQEADTGEEGHHSDAQHVYAFGEYCNCENMYTTPYQTIPYHTMTITQERAW
jgi:hypothetical protein